MRKRCVSCVESFPTGLGNGQPNRLTDRYAKSPLAMLPKSFNCRHDKT
jgi:hypothetical protein